ncbi:MAG: 3-demethylubiquinone-9 3-O-methyltransferase [Proteobacteria bacterium]|nr:3-demethylubiquinone-9 3-O-methyltransferase [Pseudomonadota bacterium]
MSEAVRLSRFDRLRLIWQSLIHRDEATRKAYLEYHLVRRKYILSQTCQHLKVNKHEPAPLLGMNLLDIGCGNNHIAEEIAFRGADCVAVDLNNDAIHLASRSAASKGSPVQFILSSAEELVRENRQYDIILCLDVLEHTADTKRLIWAVSKLLGPNGVMVFSTINRTWPSWLANVLVVERMLKWMPVGTHTWKNFLPPEELAHLLDTHGLKLTHQTGVCFNPTTRNWDKTTDTSIRYMGTVVRK